MRRQRGRVGLLVLSVLGFTAGTASAEVVTDRSASILVFPKVVADGTRDTIIQITNTSNSMVHAHCFYVNGALTDPTRPEGPDNPPLWTEIDFDIWLTKQQPTYWVVSEGRLVDAADVGCTTTNASCPNSGLDPGRVPPVVGDFTGELKCVEVDPSGAPLSGNHLKGESTVYTLADSVAKYNAIGVIGNENNNGDSVLCLGGAVSNTCPNGAEYNACPQTWVLDHYASGAADIFSGATVETSITVVPCTQNYETQVPTVVTIQFAITNEYEQTFSASTTVTCWAELDLAEINSIFERTSVGSDFVQTRMRPSSLTAAGFMVVASENYGNDDATSASNLYVEGERTGPDLITIPVEQVQ